MQLTDAREVARELLARVSLGEDPSADWKLQKSQPTISELCDEYVERHVKKLKSWKSVVSNIEGHIRPKLGKHKVGELTKDHVQAFHNAISVKTPINANRAVAALSKMMALAESWGYRDNNTNPCAGVVKNRENKRHRYMTPDEARAVSEELNKIRNPVVSDTIRLLMLTGARRGEFCGRVLNREGNLAIIGDHKSGHGKFIRLPRAAVDLVERRGMDGMKLPASQAISWNWACVCERAGVEDLHLHDLRHTFASVGLSGGVPLGVIGQLLGHSSTQTTQRYAHLVDEAGDKAVNLAADGIEKMLSGTTDRGAGR